MSSQKRVDRKREFALQEHETLLKDIEAIDAFLAGKPEQNPHVLAQGILGRLSLTECVDQLQTLIQQNLFEMPERLNRLAVILEQEFPPCDIKKGFSEDLSAKLFDQTKAHIIIKYLIDGALILFALGHNGAAIVELHSVVEYHAIAKLADLLFSPGGAETGQRIVDRLALQDAASILLDHGTLDKSDERFADKLGRLRNGLAHRNPRKIANAILSGQEIQEAEIEAVILEVDFVSYAIGAIRFLMKVVDWYEEAEEATGTTATH